MKKQIEALNEKMIELGYKNSRIIDGNYISLMDAAVVVDIIMDDPGAVEWVTLWDGCRPEFTAGKKWACKAVFKNLSDKLLTAGLVPAN